tara:strand:+ start:518 stop:1048 length:531 start_codon:yes stop_codon:yes gene_type:complete
MPAAVFLVLCALFARPLHASEAGQYLSVPDFLSGAFAQAEPTTKVFWLNAELKRQIKELTGRQFPLLRVRYWQSGRRTAWILDEIGKEMPITIGVVVEEGAIQQLRILAFRESRGWEVRHPFFTKQFDGLRLDSSSVLDGRVDSITGATLSVRAVTHVARLALLLAQQVVPEKAAS